MNVLILVSSGGAAMRRGVVWTLGVARNDGHAVRMLAPDAEAKALREYAVPTESWRPAGLFNVLRALGVLRRAVERHEPDVIHAFGWTAAAVALGSLPARFAQRIYVTLGDPIRKGEMPKTFVDKRLPELLARAAFIGCAYETLRRGIVESFGVPGDRVAVEPPAVEPPFGGEIVRPGGRPGPIVGFAGRLESDRAWEIALDGVARARRTLPEASIVFGRGGPVTGLVRSRVRALGLGSTATFLGDADAREFFAAVDVLALPGTFDGLPYALPEALIAGVPLVGADRGGIADTLAPFEAWLVADDGDGFAAGIAAAWSEIEAAWSRAATQRAVAVERFSPAAAAARLRAHYAAIASGEPAAAAVASE